MLRVVDGFQSFHFAAQNWYGSLHLVFTLGPIVSEQLNISFSVLGCVCLLSEHLYLWLTLLIPRGNNQPFMCFSFQ